MAQHKRKVLMNNDGSISYKRSVVLSIINLASKEINGIASLNPGLPFLKRLLCKNIFKGVKLNFDENKVYIDVYVNVFFGYAVNDVAYKVQENIKSSVESMTEFKVEIVNVHVLGVVFDPNQEEFAVL